jgi:hypothetical protein
MVIIASCIFPPLPLAGERFNVTGDYDNRLLASGGDS